MIWKKKKKFNWKDAAAVDQNLKVLSCSGYIMSGYYRQLILIDMIATQPKLDQDSKWSWNELGCYSVLKVKVINLSTTGLN